MHFIEFLLRAKFSSYCEVLVNGGWAADNLALRKQATQSSTIAPASLAVDGIVDDDFTHGPVTHTNSDTNAWWQVDLGASATIGLVTIMEPH
jgi:hypothetical protein